MNSLTEKFKTGPVYLAPILASLVFGMLCTSLAMLTSVPLYGVTPFSEGAGSIGNAFYFVILAGVGASLLYLLLKRKSLKLVALVIGFALTIAVFMLSTVYLYAALSMFQIPYVDALILGAAVAITILADIAVFDPARMHPA